MADYQSTFTGSQIDSGVTKALTAVQPADLANVATSGVYSDLSGTPTLGTAASTDANAYATFAQGLLADSAVQPGDNANILGSGSATDGYVLTADGSGNTVWESVPAGVTDYVSTRTGTTQSIYDMADTWNDGATTFTAIKMDVTDTASDASSLLMDLQVGGSSKFSVDKGGIVFSGGLRGAVSVTTDDGINVISGGITIVRNGFSFFQASMEGNSAVRGIRIGAATNFGFSASNDASPSGFDVKLARDAAGTLAQRNGTNAQTFNLYNTYTDASNYERGFMKWNSDVLEIGTEAAGTGTTRSIKITNGSLAHCEVDAATAELRGGNALLRVVSNDIYINTYTRTFMQYRGTTGFTIDVNGFPVSNLRHTFLSDVNMTGLPTADPLVAGRLWNDAGTLKISAG